MSTPPGVIPTPISYQRPTSFLVRPLLFILCPLTIAGLTAFPFLLGLSFVPIISFFSLPTFLSLSLFLLYSIPFLLYLLFSQSSPPPSTPSYLPYLPFSPIRNFKINHFLFLAIKEILSTRFLELIFEALLERFIALGSEGAGKRGGGKSSRRGKTFGEGKEGRIKKENIIYLEEVEVQETDMDVDEDDETPYPAPPLKRKPSFQPKRLDVYYPSLPASTSSSSTISSDFQDLAPVIVLFLGSNWRRWWRKTLANQVAMRLRRLGYCVVVPEVSTWPEGRVENMVSDIRHVMEWTGERIKTYGGDPDQIFMLGYGSGAHVALLTVVQDAVVRSRDEHLLRLSSPPSLASKSKPATEILIGSGIRRCQIWGPQARLPPIKGMILVSGVFDLIKQLRFEKGLGVEDLSSLRRCMGPGTAGCLLACPAHLLYGAKELIDPTRLPTKILVIAGGKDVFVPHLQSVLIKSLLIGVGMGSGKVKLKLYRDETHLGSLASLLHQTRYSSLFLREIEELVRGKGDD